MNSAEKPVFCGGQPIEMHEGEYNGMRAWFGYIHEAAAGKMNDRGNVLVVGGKRRNKTRLPEEGTYRMELVPNIDFEKAKTNPYYRVEMRKGTDTLSLPARTEAMAARSFTGQRSTTL